jgi:hypothetical protein
MGRLPPVGNITAVSADVLIEQCLRRLGPARVRSRMVASHRRAWKRRDPLARHGHGGLREREMILRGPLN